MAEGTAVIHHVFGAGSAKLFTHDTVRCTDETKLVFHVVDVCIGGKHRRRFTGCRAYGRAGQQCIGTGQNIRDNGRPRTHIVMSQRP